MCFGVVERVSLGLSDLLMTTITHLFTLTFVLDACIAGMGLIRSEHRRLYYLIPMLYFYFPLAIFAAYKALLEIVFVPFYWDKTQHGFSKQPKDQLRSASAFKRVT
jgi:hypothetical protein